MKDDPVRLHVELFWYHDVGRKWTCRFQGVGEDVFEDGGRMLNNMHP